MERLLEQRDARIAALNEELAHVCARNGALEATVRTLEERAEKLKSGLRLQEAGAAALQTKLGVKQDELLALISEKNQGEERAVRLRQSLAELENQKVRWEDAEKTHKETLQAVLDDRDARLTDLGNQVTRLNEANQTLELTVVGLQEKLGVSESAAALKDAEVGDLQQTLVSESDELRNLREERRSKDEEHERLKQAARELENQKAAWVKKEAGLVTKMERISSLLEDRSAALESASATVASQSEKCMRLEGSLNEKTEELGRCRADRSGLEDALTTCQHELRSVRAEADAVALQLKEKLSLSEFQLREVANRLDAKTRELEKVSMMLVNKENQLSSSSDDARVLHQKIIGLESALKTSGGSIRALESRLKEKESQVVALNGKLKSMEGLLFEGEQNVDSLTREKKQMQVQLDGLRQAVLELEKQKAGWLQREATLARETRELSFSFENKCLSLDGSLVEASAVKARCEALGTSLKNMENCLKETVNELDECKAARNVLHDSLTSCRDELRSLQAEKDLLEEEFKDKLASSQYQLKEALHELNVKSGEMSQLVKDLDCREFQLSAVKEEAQQLRQRYSSLDFTVQSLQVKNSKLAEELKRNEIEGQQWCNNIAAAESSLASSKELISKLQLKVDLGNQISAKLEAANAKVKELETVLAKVTAFAEDNEANLDVSGWAVQQLEVLKVSKAESAIAKAERERQENEFKEKLSAYELQLKQSDAQLHAKVAELSHLVKELANKELQVASMKEDLQQLREKNSSLDFTVQSLQRKISKLAEELKHSESSGQQWCNKVATLEAELASSKETISSLELKVELGNQISTKMETANANIKELETGLAELMKFAQDKDEKLDASEWAVQQLGMVEVSKAKANLAQAERERVQLKQRCADLENEVKVKEEELVDMDSCVRELRDEGVELEATRMNLMSLVEKHEVLRGEYERAVASVEDYRSQLHAQMEENFNLEQLIEKLKRDSERSQREALTSGGKLAELQAELQKTQMSSKQLVHQMLSLHENLLVEGKALLDLGKDDDSPNTACRKTSALLDCIASRGSSIVDSKGKENAPGMNTPVRPDGFGDRSPLQALQLPK